MQKDKVLKKHDDIDVKKTTIKRHLELLSGYDKMLKFTEDTING